MKLTLLALLLVSCVTNAEQERSLGKSPNGKFELLLRASAPDDYGWVVIRNISTGALSVTETAQGYSDFRTDDVDAAWKSDSTAFAVGVRGTKTTTETDRYIKDGEVWEKIKFPAFVANILGRQGVFSTGRSCNTDFSGFEGDSRFALICHVEPDFQQKEATENNVDWKPSQETDWKVILEYRRRTSPNCVIVSIEPFTETNRKQAGAGQPATSPESKSEGSDKAQPGSEWRSQ